MIRKLLERVFFAFDVAKKANFQLVNLSKISYVLNAK